MYFSKKFKVQVQGLSNVTGVTFSDSDSTPVPKFLIPAPAILQVWESNSSSESGYNHWSNHILLMFLPKKWLHRLLLLPRWKSDSGSGSGFHQFLSPDPDPKGKRRVLPESTPVQRWPESLFQTPTPLQFQNFWIRTRIRNALLFSGIFSIPFR